MENNNKDYRIKEISVTKNEYDACVRLVSVFNGKFPHKEIFFGLSTKTLFIFLNSVDMIRLDTFLKSIDIPASLYRKIYYAIDSIHDYVLHNKKRCFIGVHEDKKVKNRKQKITQRKSFFYTENNTFTNEINEVPAMFQNKIICGDAYETLRKLPDNCVDIIFTSPPYNFGLSYDTNEDTKDWKQYFWNLFKIFDEGIRVLKYGGRFIVNVQPLFSDGIPTHHILSSYFMSQKMIWKGEILWEKNNYNCKSCAFGSWKSPSSPYLKYTWEFLEIFCKGDIKKTGQSDMIDINGDEFKNWVNARWQIAPEMRMRKFDHPAMFPEALVERALKLFSYKQDVVLDMFNGAGTTTFVAKRLDRNYIGIDISQKYCDTAENRLASLF